MNYFKMLHELHDRHMNMQPLSEYSCISKYGDGVLKRGSGDECFPWAFNKIDLPVEDY